MPAVPITIVGSETSGETTSQVTITGIAFITGLEVGGGPVMPPTAPGHPEHPIYHPPGIWGGGNVPMPTPPIYLPPMPSEPPPGNAAKPPPPGGGWGYHPDFGWGYFPPQSDKPQPVPPA
jgi:hypothetical protein